MNRRVANSPRERPRSFLFVIQTAEANTAMIAAVFDADGAALIRLDRKRKGKKLSNEDWVSISHELLLRALEKHTACEWVRLYIRRWLTAPLQLADGTLVDRTKGTPQGGVVSPALANLFLHYTFDVWMTRRYPGVPWCRYADDGAPRRREEEVNM